MAEPDNAIANAFASALDELTQDRTLGLAVSGGGDSIALLTLAHQWATGAQATLTVSTVDHNLRPESRDEADLVSRICCDLGIDHHTLLISGLDGPGNLPANARNARYDALAAWALEGGVQTVLLGHTMDDQAETVLMRLARGSGAEGLSGMAAHMVWNGVRFIRPLLKISREALRTVLRDQGVEWVDDPTNADPAYDRVKARKALALLGPMGITVEGLSATADRLARQRKVLESAAEAFSEAWLTRSGAAMVLDRDALRREVPDTAMRVLASTLRSVGGRQYRPRFRALEPLYQRIVSDERTTITLSHCLVRLNAEDVWIEPERNQSG